MGHALVYALLFLMAAMYLMVGEAFVAGWLFTRPALQAAFFFIEVLIALAAVKMKGCFPFSR
jgi:hypothetical protein